MSRRRRAIVQEMDLFWGKIAWVVVVVAAIAAIWYFKGKRKEPPP